VGVVREGPADLAIDVWVDFPNKFIKGAREDVSCPFLFYTG
jgi:hypothetical protein